MSGRGRVYAISFAVLALCFVAASSLQAEIPQKINYQGKLIDSVTGEPEAGTKDMTFRIYDDPNAGTLLWSESQAVQVGSAGVFSAVLGSITPIDAAFDGPVWLEVEAGGEILSPRREMVSVPFAFRAEGAGHSQNADSLGGYSSDEFVRKGETSVITSEMIADGTGSGLDADAVDGLSADAFADSGHAHDERYYTQDVLNTPGVVNESSNPVEWTRLKGVPACFADGDDEAGGAGDGYSLDAADGDPTDALIVDAEGRVGIGTASPAPGRLVVMDSAGTSVWAYSEEGIAISGMSPDGWALNTYSVTGYAGYLDGDVHVTGDVGVGAYNPVSKLDVGGSINLSGDLKMDARALIWADEEHGLGLGWATGLQSTGEYNTFLGSRAGSSNTEGYHNTFVGFESGAENVAGMLNTFLGYASGRSNNSGYANTFLGYSAGSENTTGQWNTCVGYYAGAGNTNGVGNVFLGSSAGDASVDGSDNCFVGTAAGYQNLSGDNNTFLGNYSGSSNTEGHRNVFLGFQAGYHETGSDKLYIANGADSEDVFIYGDLEEASAAPRIGIGTQEPRWMLTINDNIRELTPSVPMVAVGNYNGNSGFAFGSSGSNYGHIAWEHPSRVSIRSTDDIRFLSGGGYVFEMDDEGHFGVGTEDPQRDIHVVGDNPRLLLEAETSNPEINFKSTGDPSAAVWALYKESSNDDLYFLQDGTIRVALKNGSSAVGIGTNNVGTYELYVQGEAYATGGWTPSDMRFKDEIGGIENALEKVLGLRGVLFSWKNNKYPGRGFPEGEHYGVIAQEAEQVMPEIVKEGPGGELAVAYSEIVPVLIESVRELKAENDALKERIAALEVSQD
jgi:hypothetical protein